MKNLVFSLLAVSSIAFGQVEKNPGDFNKVTAFDQIDVMLIPGKENSVQIDGRGADDVELVNKNGELKIRMPLLKMLDGDHISVTVYYKDLNAVEANEGSRIACGDKIESTSFDIIAKEGSEVKLILDVDKLSSRTANGSTVTLSGTAKVQDVLVNSGGIYEAENLKTQQTIITCNAGGEANIFASDLVDAKVRAGGNITIYGKPKQINQKVVAGGSVKEAK
ncbi:head GIN domain-containing protein [Flavobacterium sp. N1994]|uniref:head GIN domain-containing protein n=1 Tax=Flavobacterium sp. N1994 TaxID=2986827 RepID=UPI0022223066|nr:head GIN domain-containing protein [Flavobacterium sp. N1994]